MPCKKLLGMLYCFDEKPLFRRVVSLDLARQDTWTFEARAALQFYSKHARLQRYKPSTVPRQGSMM
jgi:hypothetical protein